ncbi:hypothetical protein CFT9_13686 [Pseudomonas sp. CFT9]|nr:hypothetical protein CFT9_13686 [Pseudomonas sp. CFT9]
MGLIYLAAYKGEGKLFSRLPFVQLAHFLPQDARNVTDA